MEGADPALRNDPEFRKKVAQLPLRLSLDMAERLRQIEAIDKIAFQVAGESRLQS